VTLFSTGEEILSSPPNDGAEDSESGVRVSGTAKFCKWPKVLLTKVSIDLKAAPERGLRRLAESPPFGSDRVMLSSTRVSASGGAFQLFVGGPLVPQGSRPRIVQKRSQSSGPKLRRHLQIRDNALVCQHPQPHASNLPNSAIYSESNYP